ncbi:MAG TPA: sensor histidine kinase, partial [Blastocatellia bacterium]|nr:sensor histidine kinase [Blastocatellia bacterium]
LRVSNAADLLALEIYALLGVVCVFGISQLMNALMVSYDRIAAVERKNALLLSEMAHRVANNFATVGALIRRKAEAMSDPEARSALDAAMAQVNLMARVHARLRSDDEDLVIQSRQFFHELCQDLRGTIPADKAIAIECSFIDTPLPFARAVLLGLIVNELLTNSVKYAFSDGRSGTVRVSLEEVGHQLCLSVWDNGVGLHGASRSSGQGRELVTGLSQQLGGKIDYRATDQGTRVQIVFPRLGSFEGKADASARESSAVPNEKRALSAERRSLH